MLNMTELIEGKHYVTLSHGDSRYVYNGRDGGGKYVFVLASTDYKKGIPAMLVYSKGTTRIDAKLVNP